jgi:hypothetical protein
MQRNNQAFEALTKGFGMLAGTNDLNENPNSNHCLLQ